MLKRFYDYYYSNKKEKKGNPTGDPQQILLQVTNMLGRIDQRVDDFIKTSREWHTLRDRECNRIRDSVENLTHSEYEKHEELRLLVEKRLEKNVTELKGHINACQANLTDLKVSLAKKANKEELSAIKTTVRERGAQFSLAWKVTVLVISGLAVVASVVVPFIIEKLSSNN